MIPRLKVILLLAAVPAAMGSEFFTATKSECSDKSMTTVHTLSSGMMSINLYSVPSSTAPGTAMQSSSSTSYVPSSSSSSWMQQATSSATTHLVSTSPTYESATSQTMSTSQSSAQPSDDNQNYASSETVHWNSEDAWASTTSWVHRTSSTTWHKWWQRPTGSSSSAQPTSSPNPLSTSPSSSWVLTPTANDTQTYWPSSSQTPTPTISPDSQTMCSETITEIISTTVRVMVYDFKTKTLTLTMSEKSPAQPPECTWAASSSTSPASSMASPPYENTTSSTAQKTPGRTTTLTTLRTEVYTASPSGQTSSTWAKTWTDDKHTTSSSNNSSWVPATSYQNTTSWAMTSATERQSSTTAPESHTSSPSLSSPPPAYQPGTIRFSSTFPAINTSTWGRSTTTADDGAHTTSTPSIPTHSPTSAEMYAAGSANSERTTATALPTKMTTTSGDSQPGSKSPTTASSSVSFRPGQNIPTPPANPSSEYIYGNPEYAPTSGPAWGRR